MDNNNSLHFFSNLALNNPNPIDVKIRDINDHTDIDARFIKKYITKASDVLDLASGSGLIINKIYRNVKHITAVEAFEEFSKYIEKTNKILVLNEDIKTFQTNNHFDLITMFGIVQYFNETEIYDIYNKYHDYLKSNGKMIIKGQFGINENVVSEGYSKELKTDYFSQYRYLKNEQKIIESTGLKIIDVVDIYPPEFNHWDNTHFYALVAAK